MQGWCVVQYRCRLDVPSALLLLEAELIDSHVGRARGRILGLLRLRDGPGEDRACANVRLGHWLRLRWSHCAGTEIHHVNSGPLLHPAEALSLRLLHLARLHLWPASYRRVHRLR